MRWIAIDRNSLYPVLTLLRRPEAHANDAPAGVKVAS